MDKIVLDSGLMQFSAARLMPDNHWNVNPVHGRGQDFWLGEPAGTSETSFIWGFGGKSPAKILKLLFITTDFIAWEIPCNNILYRGIP